MDSLLYSMTKWATGMISLRNTLKHYLFTYKSVIYILHYVKELELKCTVPVSTYALQHYKKWNLLPIKCFDFFSKKKFRMSVENDPMWNPLSLHPLSVDIPVWTIEMSSKFSYFLTYRQYSFRFIRWLHKIPVLLNLWNFVECKNLLSSNLSGFLNF